MRNAIEPASARVLVAVVLVALTLATPRPAGSTTLLKMDIERMVEDAVVVVQGHVAWNYSARPDPDGPVFTYTGLEVSRCIAGACPETVTLKHEGGTVGDLTLFISGMPRFTPGEEVLLLLEPDPNGEAGMYYTVGMVQGFFRVLTDPETGTKSAVQQLGAVTLAAPGPDGVITAVETPAPIADDLEALVERIREAFEARKKKGGGK